MGYVQWSLSDPATSETYSFSINPNDGGSPAFKKKISYVPTSSPRGRQIVFEGNSDPVTLDFSGLIVEPAFLNVLKSWYDKRRQVRLTDDLGRSFWIYIIEFVPERVRIASNPWKHKFTIKSMILDWES